ncbi:hypothetical protein DSOUD_3234 [Desulfuromonas soudanensis]|uniref:Uncharacterized protein n=1 Tax=Desulfuromonas soudanensis TaxID=1603606 RepID=A0A0M4CZ75_9BACT|nr:hypothetical protein [Desulfuromonas soudanensis]ALC17954.1 hypothetical protein DSOUD_3234 [Desulfuromonas soudanensis]
MSPTSTFCQRALHVFHLDPLMAWWSRRDAAAKRSCPLHFSRRTRQRVAWSRFVCGIGAQTDILTGKNRQR